MIDIKIHYGFNKLVTLFNITKLAMIIVLMLSLSSCGGGGGGGGGGSSPGDNPTPDTVENNLLMINLMGSVPVVNGNSTNSVIYIHNYSSKTITNVNFSLQNQSLQSKFKSILSKTGIYKTNNVEDSNGFSIFNLEQCQTIASGVSCAISFTTPTLAFGEVNHTVLMINYINDKGDNVVTSQIVDYNYVDGIAFTGVNFNGSVNVNGKAGNTVYVVGYLYASGDNNQIYKNVNLLNSMSANSAQDVRVNGGFIAGQELVSNQVVGVEFAVSIQDTDPISFNVVPVWQNDDDAFPKEGISLGMKLSHKLLDTPNYLFSNVPIIKTYDTANGSAVSILNDGAINSSGGISAMVQGEENSELLIDSSDCSKILLANAANSCQIKFNALIDSQGNATVVYKDSAGFEINRQVVTWINESSLPMVIITPSKNSVVIPKGESSGLLTFTISNIGNAMLQNINYSGIVSGPALWVPTSGTCNVTLAARASCTMSGYLSGANTGNGELTYDVNGSYLGSTYNYKAIPITYSVYSKPELLFNPDHQINIVALANSQSANNTLYTITNNGNSGALIDAIYLESMNNLYKPVINGGTCTVGNTILPNQSCSVIISYGPIDANITQNESGITHLVINYSGGVPSADYMSISEPYNYRLVGNDGYLVESIVASGFVRGNGTIANPYYGMASNESMQVRFVYRNPSVNYAFSNLNFDTSSFPYGVTVTSDSTCPIGSSTMSLTIGSSCTLVLSIDKSLLIHASQGGSVILNFSSPQATWSTPLGFYEQNGTNLYISYLQPTVNFSLNHNNGYFESTAVTAVLVNESAGISPFVIVIDQESGFLESAPVILTSNCQLQSSDSHSVLCSLSGSNYIGQVAYIMPNYLQPESVANIPLLFRSVTPGYLSPRYSFIHFIQE